MGNVDSQPVPEPVWGNLSDQRRKEEILAELNGAPFVDNDFHPGDSSLYYDKTKVSWPAEGIHWARSAADPDLPSSITDGQIGPNDLQQGMLGDCYLLSALSVLAEKPERILKLLGNSTETNASGCYSIKMYKRGIEKEVVVDDHIPCLPKSLSQRSQAIFSRSKSGEMWPMLIEKAYAKLHGGYQQIEAGMSTEALEDLTGAPSSVYNTKEMSTDELFKQIADADRLNYVMCASTKDGDTEAEKLGFITKHAYGLIAAKEKDGLKLLQIRNPWGNTEWTGDWSDKSPLWTDETKAFFGWEDKDDGTFWMSVEDFVKYFERISVLFYEDGFQNSAFELGPGQRVVELKVPPNPQGQAKVPSWVSLKAVDKRVYPAQANYNYPAMRFQVVCAEPAEDRGVAAWSRESKMSRDLHEKVELVPGLTYYVIVNRQPASGPITVSVYSPLKMTMSLHQEPEKPDLLGQIYEAEILKSGTVHGNPEEDYGPGVQGVELKELKFPWGIGYALVNKSESLQVTDTTMFKLQNLDILPTTKIPPTKDAEGNLHVVLKAGPGGTSSFVLFTRNVAEGYGYERGRRVAVQDANGDSKEKLEAIRTEALAKGKQMQPYQGADEKIKKFQYELEGGAHGRGSAFAYMNEQGSEKCLMEKAEFQLKEMEVWSMGPGGDVQKLEGGGPFEIQVNPGETYLMLLRPTEKGQFEGYGYGSSYSYAIQPLH